MFAVVLAVAVPRLGLFISLFGALCLSALGICFPAIMEACLCIARGGSRLKLVKDALLFIVGIVGLVAGMLVKDAMTWILTYFYLRL